MLVTEYVPSGMDEPIMSVFPELFWRINFISER
nr:MAG TPA: hypothetical protein [Caudoviricetes sp.]